jgi:hypothetical protein
MTHFIWESGQLRFQALPHERTPEMRPERYVRNQRLDENLCANQPATGRFFAAQQKMKNFVPDFLPPSIAGCSDVFGNLFDCSQKTLKDSNVLVFHSPIRQSSGRQGPGRSVAAKCRFERSNAGCQMRFTKIRPKLSEVPKRPTLRLVTSQPVLLTEG